MIGTYILCLIILSYYNTVDSYIIIYNKICYIINIVWNTGINNIDNNISRYIQRYIFNN